MTADKARQDDWFEDQAIGRTGRSPTRTVTDHDLIAFAGLTGDMAELHTSETYAAATPFGGRIAHGMFNLSLMHGLVVRSGRLVSSGVALLGWADVRFSAPVRIGDTVQATWTTVALRDSASRPDAGIVSDALELRNQTGDLVVSGTVSELVRKRPAGA